MNAELRVLTSLVAAFVSVSATARLHSDTPVGEVVADNNHLYLRLNDKYFATWTLNKGGRDEFEDLSERTKGIEGMLCIETNLGMTCHKLRKGQIGSFKVLYQGKSYHVYLRI